MVNIIKEVVVHDGVYHADDVCCFALLKTICPQSISFYRTREITEAMLEDSSIVVCDVGGVYEPSMMVFDHHQEGVPEFVNGTPSSAIGLLLNQIKRVMPLVDAFYAEDFLEELCVLQRKDNGVGDAGERSILTEYVHSFIPTWDSGLSLDEGFAQAAGAVSDIFRLMMGGFTFRSAIDALWVESKIAERRLLAAESVERGKKLALDAQARDGEIVYIPYPGIDWSVIAGTDAKFVYYKTGTGSINLQAVPPTPGSFEQKIPIPMDILSGIPMECKPFVHKAGFLCSLSPSEMMSEKEIIDFYKVAAQSLIDASA